MRYETGLDASGKPFLCTLSRCLIVNMPIIWHNQAERIHSFARRKVTYMTYLYLLPAAILVPAIHEGVKALVSTLQGDPSPRRYGYLTINPFKYFEPIGFLFIMMFGFGWGRPVPTTALHYRDRKLGIVLTYTVPVLVNLLLGIGTLVFIRVLLVGPNSHMFSNPFFGLIHEWRWMPHAPTIGIHMLTHFAAININYALFNLIPVYPLAANKLLITFSSPDNIARLNHYEKPMQLFLIIFMVFGLQGRFGSGPGLIPQILSSITLWISDIVWGLQF